MSAWQISRRLFLTRAASVAALFGVARGSAASTSQPHIGDQTSALTANPKGPRPEPVVSFHMDQPYLDMTGTAVPYIPPAGTRSGQPLSELSVEEFYACLR